MKIEFLNKGNKKEFGNLNLGDVFVCNNKLFLKINYADDKRRNMDAFDLINNNTTYIESGVLVEPRDFILKEV